jgi:dipeptidyl aminopeptidase/acylaminoacyl peptidase
VSLRHFSAISGLLGGDADRKVPVRQAELLHTALLAAGARSTFSAVEGADHVFDGHPNAQQLVEQVAAFFAQEFAQPAAA